MVCRSEQAADVLLFAWMCVNASVTISDGFTSKRAGRRKDLRLNAQFIGPTSADSNAASGIPQSSCLRRSLNASRFQHPYCWKTRRVVVRGYLERSDSVHCDPANRSVVRPFEGFVARRHFAKDSCPFCADCVEKLSRCAEMDRLIHSSRRGRGEEVDGRSASRAGLALLRVLA